MATTAERTDLYAVLGLTPQATEQQIRRAYRALVRRHHPDTRPVGGPDDSAVSNSTLQRAMAAYLVLGDPASRAGYDRRRTTSRPATVPLPSRPVRWSTRLDARRPPIQAGPVFWRPSR